MHPSKLKIGLDYHGVIDSDYEYFAEFAAFARSRGHRIYVISGAPKVALCNELSQHNFTADFLFSVLDYCMALGLIVQDAFDIKIDDYAWNRAKAEFCFYNHINLHIDDNQQYCNYFSTICCCFNGFDRFCRISENLILDFSLPPDNALIMLEKVLK